MIAPSTTKKMTAAITNTMSYRVRISCAWAVTAGGGSEPLMPAHPAARNAMTDGPRSIARRGSFVRCIGIGVLEWAMAGACPDQASLRHVSVIEPAGPD